MFNESDHRNVLKNGICYIDLECNDENEFFFYYGGNPYSGIGFSQNEVSERLNGLYVYKDGIEYGVRRRWHENGVIEEERLVQENTDGYVTKWDVNGNIVFEELFIRGTSIFRLEGDKVVFTGGTSSFRDKYNNKHKFYLDEIEKRESFSDTIEKNFKDSSFINGILEIFQKYENCDSDDVVCKIESEILEFYKAERTIRERINVVFRKVIREDEGELIEDKMFFEGDLFTGLMSKFSDDEELSSDVLIKLTSYRDGVKDGFEIKWDSEEKLKPQNIDKFGVRQDDYLWWSKTIIRELSIYHRGVFVESEKWENFLSEDEETSV